MKIQKWLELWGYIAFPLGIAVGIFLNLIITLIIKGWNCIA